MARNDFTLSVQVSASAANFRSEMLRAQQGVKLFGDSVKTQGQAAVGNFRTELLKAQTSARLFGDSVQGQAGKVGSAFRSAATSTRQFAKQTELDMRRAMKANEQGVESIGRGALVAGAGIAAGIGLAVTASLRFDKEISVLGGVADATGKEMSRLREVILQAGAATSFSATEAAKGAQELARAGVSATDIINGGLMGALNLATAGQLGLAEAAEIAASAMNVFKLQGQDVGHVADVLAAAANQAQGTVGDMGFALSQSALVAKQLGLTLEDTVGTLALFASNGLLGSDAGTSFKTMLQRLTPVSQESAKEMRRLGIDFFDAQGNFVGIEKAAGVLQTRMGGLSQEQRALSQNIIFGSDAVRAANILFEAGEEGVRKWGTRVDQAGEAARMAEKNMDNLAGDLEQLKGAFETALIRSGEQADGVLRKLVQTATDAVSMFSAMPGQVQGAGLAMAAVTAALTAGVGAMVIGIPKYQEFKKTILEMGDTGQRLATGLTRATQAVGILGPVLAIGTVIYGRYAAEKQRAKESTDRFVEAIRAEREGQTDANAAAVVAELGKRKQAQTIKDLGVGYKTYTDAVLGSTDAQSKLKDELIAGSPQAKFTETDMKNLGDALNGNKEAAERFGKSFGGEFGGGEWAERQRNVGDFVATFGQMKSEFSSAVEQEKLLRLAAGETTETTSQQRRAMNLLSLDMAGATTATGELTEEQKKLDEAMGQAVDVVETFKAFDSAGNVLKKFGGQQDVTGAQIKDFYTNAIKNTESFMDLYKRGLERGLDPAFMGQLLQAGPEQAAPILKGILEGNAGDLTKIVNTSTDKLREMSELSIRIARVTNMAVNAQSEEMAKNAPLAMAIVTEAYRLGGESSADAIARELGIGVEQVNQIAGQYKLSIGGAANELNRAFGAAPIVLGKSKGFENATGDADRGIGYADGGVLPNQATIAPGRTLVQWAEPETGGEAFIPLASGKRGRSTSILKTVAGQFGYDLIEQNARAARAFASGGIFGAQPPPQIGNGVWPDAGEAVMDYEWRLLQALNSQLEAARSVGAVGGSWQSLVAGLKGTGIPFTVTSTTGGTHAKGSYHYQGKAVDLVGPNMMQIFKSFLGSASQLSELFYTPAGFSIKNGKRVAPIAAADHYDHVHAATYDNGGALMPGWNMAFNGTGRPEPVVPEAQLGAIIERAFERAVGRSGGGNTVRVEGMSKARTLREVSRALG